MHFINLRETALGKDFKGFVLSYKNDAGCAVLLKTLPVAYSNIRPFEIEAGRGFGEIYNCLWMGKTNK